MMEYWKNGIMGVEMASVILKKSDINPFKPILPTFQYSNIPNPDGLK